MPSFLATGSEVITTEQVETLTSAVTDNGKSGLIIALAGLVLVIGWRYVRRLAK